MSLRRLSPTYYEMEDRDAGLGSVPNHQHANGIHNSNPHTLSSLERPSTAAAQHYGGPQGVQTSLSQLSSFTAMAVDGGEGEGGLQEIIDRQQQIIDSQAELIRSLGQELARVKEELGKSRAVREQMEKLVSMTERAEEEANEQVVALEERVIRLTELLRAHGFEGAGV